MSGRIPRRTEQITPRDSATGNPHPVGGPIAPTLKPARRRFPQPLLDVTPSSPRPFAHTQSAKGHLGILEDTRAKRPLRSLSRCPRSRHVDDRRELIILPLPRKPIPTFAWPPFIRAAPRCYWRRQVSNVRLPARGKYCALGNRLDVLRWIWE